MKFAIITLGCLILGGAVGAVAGTIHKNATAVIQTAHDNMLNPNFWR